MNVRLVSRVKPPRFAALAAAAVIGLVAASARADDLPGAFGGHGVSFTYPESWLHSPGTFQVQSGTVLWTEFFGPAQAPTAPPSDPSQPAPSTPSPATDLQRDVVAVAAYRTTVSITKRNLPRYRRLINLFVSQLTAQAHGQVLSGPIRTAMGGLPGYRFQITALLTDGTTVESRLVLVFKKRTEYFLNCQHVQNGPFAQEIESGCDQVMSSFRISP
jgi:hypothetical protein